MKSGKFPFRSRDNLTLVIPNDKDVRALMAVSVVYCNVVMNLRF